MGLLKDTIQSSKHPATRGLCPPGWWQSLGEGVRVCFIITHSPVFLVDFHRRLPVLPLSEPSSVVTWGCHFTEEPAVDQAFTDTTSFNSVPRGYHCNPHFTEADTKPQKGESCQASHSLWLEFTKLQALQSLSLPSLVGSIQCWSQVAEWEQSRAWIHLPKLSSARPGPR